MWKKWRQWRQILTFLSRFPDFWRRREGNHKYYKLTKSRFDSTIFESELRHNKTCWLWRTYEWFKCKMPFWNNYFGCTRRNDKKARPWRIDIREGALSLAMTHLCAKRIFQNSGRWGRTHNLKLGNIQNSWIPEAFAAIFWYRAVPVPSSSSTAKFNPITSFSITWRKFDSTSKWSRKEQSVYPKQWHAIIGNNQ